MKPLPQIREDVSGFRAERERLVSERIKISRAPVDAATLEARVDTLIAEALREENNPLSGLADPEGNFSIGTFNNRALNNPFAAYARIAPKGLRAAMLQCAGDGGLTEQERASKLGEVNAALSSVEISEELALRDIDAQTGGLEYRRSDADPVILLAPTSELEAAAKPAKGGGFFKRAS